MRWVHSGNITAQPCCSSQQRTAWAGPTTLPAKHPLPRQANSLRPHPTHHYPTHSHSNTHTLCRECDHVLTTRELAKVVADKGWDYAQLPEADFDSFLGLGSGAAALFGTTGGVMEAALRCGAGSCPA